MRKAKKYLNDNNIHYDTLNGKVKSMIEKILGYTDNEDTIHIIDKVNMNGGRVVLPKEYFNGGNIYNTKKYLLRLKKYISMRGGKLSMSKELEKQINENMELLLLNSIVDKSHDKKTITVKSLNDSAKLLKSICKF